MYYLTSLCFLCLKNNIKVQSVLFQDTDGIVLNEKLRCFFPEIIDSTPDEHKLACSDCLEKLRISYDFTQSVMKNNTAFRDYIHKLKCQREMYQQILVVLPRSKHRTVNPFTRDFIVNTDEKCGEELITNENEVFFTKFSCQTEEIMKIENIETEEIYIKEEPRFDDDFSGNYLDEDTKESEDNIYECQFCHLSFSSSIHLENHTAHCNKKTQIQERNVTNKIDCDTGSNPNNNGSFKCHICDNMYTIKTLYDRHLLVKHHMYDTKQRRNAKYNQNNRTESTDSNSTSSHSGCNVERTNKETKKRRYRCTDCSKAFTCPSNLEAHTRIHTGERPFKCEICPKTFTQASNLKIHVLTHTGEKPHSCDICQKSFNTLSTLITHKRSHDNVRPYQCSVCKKTFTQTSHLTRHMFIHSGLKPYHCHICHYKCTEASNLKKHIRTHTGERM